MGLLMLVRWSRHSSGPSTMLASQTTISTNLGFAASRRDSLPTSMFFFSVLFLTVNHLATTMIAQSKIGTR